MKKEPAIKEVDIHLLDRRYAHTRIKNAQALARMQNSISRYGQIVPAHAVLENGRFILIDGYLRLKALQSCGHDCIKLQVVEEKEDASLLLLLAQNNDRHWEVIEQAALIKELHCRFNYSFGEIARRLGRDKSFVKRRLDLVSSLPEEIKSAVMAGKVSSWSASHVLVPLSRVNSEDALRLTGKLLEEPLSTRELARLYSHYKKSTRIIRDRIIAAPVLFIKAVNDQEQSRDAKQINEGPEGKWLKDITIVCHMLKRLLKGLKEITHANQEPFQRRQRQLWITKAERLLQDLTKIAGRKCDDNSDMPRDDSGDGRQGVGAS